MLSMSPDRFEENDGDLIRNGKKCVKKQHTRDKLEKHKHKH